ncbi:hypothetical protein CSB37_03815 [bacterium DOLZORAL124_38_8]|nr:MAG: hypothetical protein CSB37_03815 [bacterium DOLZORAL124_38_8]
MDLETAVNKYLEEGDKKVKALKPKDIDEIEIKKVLKEIETNVQEVQNQPPSTIELDRECLADNVSSEEHRMFVNYLNNVYTISTVDKKIRAAATALRQGKSIWENEKNMNTLSLTELEKRLSHLLPANSFLPVVTELNNRANGKNKQYRELLIKKINEIIDGLIIYFSKNQVETPHIQ